jgi:hypothetical protein
MTALAPSVGGADARKVTVWTHRSLWMVPTFLAVFFVTSYVGQYVMLPWLGLGEGDLMLMERGVAGWTSEIAFGLLLVAPAVAGVVLAVAALRHAGRWTA